jgi:hypothetical protein
MAEEILWLQLSIAPSRPTCVFQVQLDCHSVTRFC